jgi:XRE family transcriptional regulator, aerobic/anaerobic benzoate catabolism transcriptional regulator
MKTPTVSKVADFQEPKTLPELGGRVRAWRARRGMTRKQLAADSGLSERFLADVEAGKGNVSINSLEAVAQALHISILELMQDTPQPAMARVQSLLLRLEEAQLDQAYSLLGNTFGLIDTAGRELRIALIGLRGAGKAMSPLLNWIARSSVKPAPA